MVLCYCCVSHGGPGRGKVPKGVHIFNCELEDFGLGHIPDEYDYDEFENYVVKPIQTWWRNIKNEKDEKNSGRWVKNF